MLRLRCSNLMRLAQGGELERNDQKTKKISVSPNFTWESHVLSENIHPSHVHATRFDNNKLASLLDKKSKRIMHYHIQVRAFSLICRKSHYPCRTCIIFPLSYIHCDSTPPRITKQRQTPCPLYIVAHVPRKALRHACLFGVALRDSPRAPIRAQLPISALLRHRRAIDFAWPH